jgi:uncharacterized protein YqjF (DUF2071 family)
MDRTIEYPPTTTEPVLRAVMQQGWRDLTYVHWPYEPEQVQGLLPAGLTVDTFDGAAWVGLVAFHMERIRVPGTPAIPYLGTFPETNVRTYVRGPDGRPGVWFHSLDVNRLLPVLVARASYRLPYMWSKMAIDHDRDRVTYVAHRRWPGPQGVFSDLSVRRRSPIKTPSGLEHFLTNRWGLFTKLRTRLAYAPVDHPTWPLENADIVDLQDGLVAAAGYPSPTGQPLVHYSPGVEVRIGLPRRLTHA